MAGARGLTRESIVDVTLALVDEEGLAKVSARRVATVLGVRPMAIYHYFANMDALLDAVLERVLSGVELGEPSGDTRSDLLTLQRNYVAALKRHPGAIPLLAGRRFNSAGTLPALDRIFSVLRAAGLSPPEIALAFRIQGYFINGAMMAYAATLEANRRKDFALPDPDFLAAWPGIAEVVPHLAADGLDVFLEEGIALILDGLESRWASDAQLAPKGKRGSNRQVHRSELP